MASLLAQGGLINTAAVDKVVAPIVSHLVYLVLLCEGSDGQEEPEHMSELEAAAQVVARATKNMAAVANKRSDVTEDDVMRREMSYLVEPMILSGQHVLLAAQKLSIQPRLAEHRDELITATQNVLLGMIKILLVEDDATVRKIQAAANQVLDGLSLLASSVDIQALFKAFQKFSEDLVLLNNLVVQRAETLQDPRQTENLQNCLDTLKKCISLLHSAIVTTIKHPTSEQARASKTYILRKVKSTVNDIVTTLKSERCRDGGVSGMTGYYTERRDGLISLLASSSSIGDSNFDSLLRDLVFHCVTVANSSRQELQHSVVDHCRHVLEFWTEINRLIKFPEHLESDHLMLQSICSSLMQRICLLDSDMMTAILYLVLDTSVTGSRRHKVLVDLVGQVLEGHSGEDLQLNPDSLQPLLADFLSQSDEIIQVASFISAFATDFKGLENMENSRACFTRLKAGIKLLMLELNSDSSDSEKFFEVLQKLHTLCQRWEEETIQLQGALCDVLDVKQLTSLAVFEMANELRECNSAYKAENPELFGKLADNLISHTKQVFHAVRRHLDKSDNPIYRNGLRVLLKQVEASQAKVVSVVREVWLGSDLDVDVCSIFLQHVSVMIQQFQVLREGLDGQKHPHLLSPLREEARHCRALPSVGTANKAQWSALHQEVRDIGQAPEQALVVVPSERHSPAECKVEPSKKERVDPALALEDLQYDLKGAAVSGKAKSILKPLDFDLLPLLYEVVTVTKEKDVTVLSKSCTLVLKLSNCYAHAAKEASTLVDTVDMQTLDILRSELVSLTPQLVQIAQETAMSSNMNIDPIYKHSTLLSDLIKNLRKLLLPAAGAWYQQIYSMFQGCRPNMASSGIAQELSEVMNLCSNVVQLLTSSDITTPSGCKESFMALHSKLNKAHNNTRHLIELATSSTSGQADQHDGPCILWALSIQILLKSLDTILGTRESLIRQLTSQKRLAAISENSLRIQEAARLTCSNCKSSYEVKTLTELQEELKVLTEDYLQVAENYSVLTDSGILQFARSELLRRQLLIKMRVMCSHLKKTNKDYGMPIRDILHIAYTAAEQHEGDKISKEARERFDTAAELLIENVRAATKSVEDCFNYIRQPRVRVSLRSINDHLSFQISDIVSRARLIAETGCIDDTLTLEILIQCWSAKARYVTEEIYTMDGLNQEAKEQVKLDLQLGRSGSTKEARTGLSTTVKRVDYQPVIAPWQQITAEDINTSGKASKCIANPQLHLRTTTKQYSLIYTTTTPCLTYTSLFLKQETDQWDAQDNRIVQVTREMADQIYQMAQYLRKKGPILSKEMFVGTAKGVVSNCQSISNFLKVIVNHCLDQQSSADLCLRVEQILTITNQLTIISSVNALTAGSKSSDEILVKNAQNLLKIVLQGVQAAETACIKGLKQPEPNSEGAEAASMCFQWKRNLQMHRAQQNSNPDTDDLGLRKTSMHRESPSLAPPTHIKDQGFK
ncbi:hypothetical protein DPEC_G00360150 [Dallia pectoralis]|uniref:Uncharacterized protein n=1 Tax=Dallia pectoralis TaxID=75939 RepID=A0ACC2F0Q2_DALPE|nr:hypothetical protein DPEC_G00360150 [Dallia pectoralis]